MTDRDAMREYTFSYSRPEDCKIVSRPDGSPAILTRTELLIATEWRRVEQVYRDAENLARKLSVLPALILHGPATADELRIATTAVAFRGFLVYWVGQENIIRHRALVSEVLGARDRAAQPNTVPEAIAFAI